MHESVQPQLSADEQPVRGRVLFLAMPFPPRTSSGAVRTGNLAKYLQKAGWQVEVVTIDPAFLRLKSDDPRVELLTRQGVRIRYTGLDSAFCYWGMESRLRTRLPLVAKALATVVRLLRIDNGVGWVRPALKACRDLKPGDIDVVLATGSPFFSFGIANRLARRLRCPYVLDYRDLWQFGPHQKGPFWPLRLAERTWLVHASKVVFVSWGAMEIMAQWLGSSKRMVVITNGYDAEECSSVRAASDTAPAVVYAGILYPPDRTLTPILQALKELRGAPDCPQLHYYGLNNREVQEEAEMLGVADSVILHGQTQRARVLEATKTAKAAVVITTVYPSASPEHRAIIPGKLFEPLGLRTPVLLIAPPGSDARRVVDEADAGRAFTGDQVEQIADFITKVCGGELKSSFAAANIYSWELLGAAFDRALVDACRKRAC